jgi:hypothetical protein
MERLARLVEQLRASVEAFKLRDSQGGYFTPNSPGYSLNSEGNHDDQLTVSGVFRTVSATVHPAQMPSGPNNSLVAAQGDDGYAIYTSSRQNGTPSSGTWDWNTPQPPNNQSWGG